MTYGHIAPTYGSMNNSAIALPYRAALSFEGPDALSFLNGQVTQNLSGTDIPTLKYGAFLRPQGKIITDAFFFIMRPDLVLVDVAATEAEGLLKRLNLMRLRAKVVIRPLEEKVCISWQSDTDFFKDPRLPDTSLYRGFSNSGDSDLTKWNQFRMTHNISETGTDFGADRLYAADANLDLLNGVDFKKGCFVGQELTSRMKRRGQIKNRLFSLSSTHTIPIGAKLLQNDREVGDVLSAYEHLGMGLIRLDRLTSDWPVTTENGLDVKISAQSWQSDAFGS